MSEYSRPYQFKKKEAKPIPIVSGDVPISDKNLKFKIGLREIQQPYKLDDVIQVQLLVPLRWNSNLKRWEIVTQDGFVNATVDSNNYLNVHARTVDQLPDSLSTAGNLKVSIEESSIKVPTDKQAIYREMQFETTTNLGANASYTSVAMNMNNFSHLTGFVYADVDGVLKIQVSSNASNWYDAETISVTGGTTVTFIREVVARWYRIVYTNGSTAQSSFRLVAYAVVR